MKALQYERKKPARIVGLLCAVLLMCMVALLVAPVARADTGEIDNGYTITDFHVEAVLHADNTITQTETISVHFNEQRHGIFRSLPEMVYVNQDTERGVERMGYRVRIRDIQVDGAPFDTESTDGYRVIRIGDEDETVIGPAKYTVSYTYDIGDDRVSTYDGLFYSLNGPDCNTWIEQFSFALRFEQPLPQQALDTLSLTSGAYGVQDNEYMDYTYSADGIEGVSVEALPPQTAVSVFARLPEGYFTGERGISVVPAYIALALGVLLGLYVLMRALLTKQSRPVETVEFYPPDGMTSAEVGYIIDGTSDDKDVISLVIWLADKGYVTLTEENELMRITRVKALPPDAPAYLQVFYNALFADGETRGLDKLDAKFAKAFSDAKAKLASHFDGERNLVSSVAQAIMLPVLCAVLWGVFGALAGCAVDVGTIVFSAFAALVLVAVAVLRLFMSARWIFSSRFSRIAHVVLVALLGFAGLSITALLWTESVDPQGVIQAAAVFVPAWTVWGSYLLMLACAIAGARLVRETPYAVEMNGKLLGLRNFIQKAELPRIKALVEEDPNYFYNVLPYAYVFGLSEKWVEQFESLALQPPDWYSGSNAFTCMYLNHSLQQSFSHSLSELHTISTNSGSGTGGHGGSGGFSGGGFGGGGTGSW